jgi:hypothetical protein
MTPPSSPPIPTLIFLQILVNHWILDYYEQEKSYLPLKKECKNTSSGGVSVRDTRVCIA